MYQIIKTILRRYAVTPPVSGLFVSVFLIFAIIMLWSTHERQQSFMTNQIYIGERAAINARDAVNNALESRRRFVRLFVEDNIESIRALVTDPDDDELFHLIKLQLLRYIPDLFTINLTSDNAELLITDFDGFTGAMCLNDVKVFAESGHHLSRVHPNHILYHYDILERFEADDNDYIFFASFGFDDLKDALKHASPKGHQLILAQVSEETTLIEITEQGGRNKVKDRLDFRLTNDEQLRVLSQTKIEGTYWSVLDIIDADQIAMFNSHLVKQNIIVFLIFTILLLIVRYFIVSKILKQSHKIHDLNNELKALLLIDSLTGLYNKAYLETQLAKEWSRALRDKKKITVLLIDIDYFKRYNDNYGHLQGDKCLQEVACVLLDTFQRENDFAARFGGEEFCIVLNDDSANEPEVLAAKAHVNLEEKHIKHEFSLNADFVTYSIGVASVVPTHDKTPEWFLNRADKALYQAKYNGRNNTYICNEDESIENC